MVDMKVLVDYYTTNFSSCYSPDGKYLAIADGYGRIFIFGLSKLLRSNVTTTKVNRCTFSFKRKQCAIYALITNDDQLLCGCSDGTVVAYSWSDICKQKIHQLYSFSADNQSSEVNCILGEKENESIPRIFTGGGDNMIHVWDIENKKETHKFAGHTDYIHALAHGPHGTLISGSEDGTVRFWDLKAGSKPVHLVKPFESDCSTPSRGKWIGAVASNSDFVVCGGGPKLGLWHVGSYSLVKPLESKDVDHHCVMYHDDKIIASGAVGELYHWDLNGDFITNVPISVPTVFDVQFNSASKKYPILSVCGDGPEMDLFLNLGYSSFVLETKT